MSLTYIFRYRMIIRPYFPYIMWEVNRWYKKQLNKLRKRVIPQDSSEPLLC